METTTVQPTSVPLWGWLLVAVALFGVYLMTMENGLALSADSAQRLHELFHDARHFIGVPCN